MVDYMKCVWLEDKQLTFRADVSKAFPEDEILVKVLRSGICNTDTELIKGYYPFTGVLGHEFVGVVVDTTSDMLGKRVVGEINCVCNNCRFCNEGMKTHCSNRTVLGIVNRSGAHAEYLSLPAQNLLVVPDRVSTRDACFTEPLAAALEIHEQITISRTDNVAIIGDGKLGLLVAKSMAVLTECHLTVYGHHQDKLDLLLDKNEQNEKDSGMNKRVTTQIGLKEGDSKSYDIVVECTGSKEAFAQAVTMLRPRGCLVMKSTHEGKTEFDASVIVVNELTLVGSRCGPFDKALALLESGRLDLSQMLDREFPLSQALEAFDYARQEGVLKVQLVNE